MDKERVPAAREGTGAPETERNRWVEREEDPFREDSEWIREQHLVEQKLRESGHL